MTKRIKQLLLFSICCIAALMFSSLSAKAADLQDWDGIEKPTTKYADLTGDGKDETIRFDPIAYSESSYDGLKLYVNNTQVLKLKTYPYNYLRAHYIKMSAKKEFIQIAGVTDNDYLNFNYIYRYDSKKEKLVKVLDLTTTIDSSYDVDKVTSKEIRVVNYYQPVTTGGLNWKMTYTYKNGAFRPKSTTAKAKSALIGANIKDGYQKYFDKSEYKAARKIVFYKKTNMAKKSFTLKKGGVVKLLKVKNTGKHLYGYFKKGKKTGWIRLDRNYSEKEWFYGVYNRLAG